MMARRALHTAGAYRRRRGCGHDSHIPRNAAPGRRPVIRCQEPRYQADDCVCEPVCFSAECLSLVDLSLMVKSGVQFSLWGGRCARVVYCACYSVGLLQCALCARAGMCASARYWAGSNTTGPAPRAPSHLKTPPTPHPARSVLNLGAQQHRQATTPQLPRSRKNPCCLCPTPHPHPRSVLNLGTEQHRRRYFDDIGSFRLPGCFAMTELAHGSNVG